MMCWSAWRDSKNLLQALLLKGFMGNNFTTAPKVAPALFDLSQPERNKKATRLITAAVI